MVRTVSKPIKLKIKAVFPNPQTRAECGALMHLAGLEMTLDEAQSFDGLPENKQLTLMNCVLERLENKWNNALQSSYFEWLRFYQTHGN